MIEIKNLVKKYSEFNNDEIVINDISLNIKRGEFVAITGQSGSGKSKLIQLIGGLVTLDSGSIIVDNKDISKMKDKALSQYRKNIIGFVFQDFHLEGISTVLENVMYPLKLSGTNRKKRKELAMKALETVGIADKANSKANTLSGGQKQKVAIARAIINEPKILLADEPTGNLDSRSGEQIIEFLKTLNEKGYTILMVTHNMKQAEKADRIIKIQDGKLLDEETEDSNIVKDLARADEVISEALQCDNINDNEKINNEETKPPKEEAQEKVQETPGVFKKNISVAKESINSIDTLDKNEESTLEEKKSSNEEEKGGE